jgi:hypothetical protein
MQLYAKNPAPNYSQFCTLFRVQDKGLYTRPAHPPGWTKAPQTVWNDDIQSQNLDWQWAWAFYNQK